jgi:hypothetical protein
MRKAVFHLVMPEVIIVLASAYRPAKSKKKYSNQSIFQALIILVRRTS